MGLAPLLVDLLKGLGVSVELFLLTLVFALPLGLLVAFGRMSRHRAVRQASRVYISVLRGTPLMLQLLFVYFGPYYLFRVSLSGYSPFVGAVVAFALNYAAYFAEIYRAGIESIDPGQREAASSLGLGRARTFAHVVFPQVVKRIIPPVTNEVITLVKDTSLAFTLSVMEMFTVAKMAAAARTTMVPLIAAGVFYYLFNGLVAWAMARLERHYAYYE